MAKAFYLNGKSVFFTEKTEGIIRKGIEMVKDELHLIGGIFLMRYAVSVTDTTFVKEIEESGISLNEQLADFAKSLAEITSFEKPRGIVFHDLKSATELYSEIPLPAYTSRDLIHINPLTEVWKDIFLESARGKSVTKAELYYSSLEDVDVAIIAAHELTHHADFFRDDFEGDEENMWFEEGMCDYIARKFMLSEEKFDEVSEVENLLIEAYKEDYGEYTLDQFGKSGYRQGNSSGYSADFYDYWRSTKTVRTLVEKYFDGSVGGLIDCYEKWDEKVPLHLYFVNRLELSEEESKRLWFR
ncbi:hypothetical protein [Halobacillus amylolyticus]|uniref:Uncharacterized protein n=1 Tax=Halobacillus amylolyticus TaxID=2932259 RepID=A0ABY4HCS2_9BACI|nr:hypothetical protein [Halobacillus amylolyticus]UOR11210.1 hypothetical protein MUO15_16650 [Halobacillus amylolyticus]